MNRLIAATATLGMGLASLTTAALAQENPTQGISTNANGSRVTSTAGVNPTANGEGGTIVYGDITTGPGYTVIGPPSVERSPAPAPAPVAAPAPAPAAAPAPAPVERAVATATDQDADNIADELEGNLGLDPTNVDSDGDHVADGDEINIYNTDPVVWDTDGDGFGDGEELFGIMTDPLVWTDESVTARQPATSASMAQEAAGDVQPYQETATEPAIQSLPQGTTESLTAADGNAAALGSGDASASPGTVTPDGVTTSVLEPDGTYNVTETAPPNVTISGDTEVLSPPTTAPANTGASTSEGSVASCGNYGSWYDAQLAYEAAGMTSADPALVASLDPDYDGIACEDGM